MAEANADFDLELDSWPGLEAQVAAIADDIAYDNHDIDDGLRAGIIDLDELIEAADGGAALAGDWRAAPGHPARPAAAGAGPRPDRHDGQRRAGRDRGGGSMRRGSRRSTRCARAGRSLVGFSAALGRGGPGAQDPAPRAAVQFAGAGAGAAGGAAGGRQPRRRLSRRSQAVARGVAGRRRRSPNCARIGDFIAGMTDRFAIARHEELVGPVNLPDRF